MVGRLLSTVKSVSTGATNWQKGNIDHAIRDHAFCNLIIFFIKLDQSFAPIGVCISALKDTASTYVHDKNQSMYFKYVLDIS